MQTTMQLKKNRLWPWYLAIFAMLILVPMVSYGGYADSIGQGIGHIIYYLLIKPFVYLLQVELIILPKIAQFNTFAKMDAVSQGWMALRDMSNMFFIIILLLMSFATILKFEAYGYKQVLRKLILMAILINFSKLIVGLIIDFFQLIMLTFVATWKDVAAGNITAALGLNDLMRFKAEDKAIAQEGFFEVIGAIVVAYLFAAIFLIMTCIVVFAFIFVLLARIVMFWILIVLSPFAFLANAFPLTQQYFSQWMSAFSKELIVGPVLAFFLWLSFTIVGSGNIDQQFKAQSAQSNKTFVGGANSADQKNLQPNIGNLTQATEPNNFLKYIVGIAMLIGSLKVTQSIGGVASGVGATAASKAKKVVGAATLGVAAWAGMKAWQGSSGFGGIKGGLQRAGSAVAATPLQVAGLIPGLQSVNRLGLKVRNAERKRKTAKEQAMEKETEGMTGAEKRDFFGENRLLRSRYADRGLDKIELENGEFKDDKRKETQAKYDRAKKVNDTATMTKLENSFGFLQTADGIQAALKAGKGQETYSKVNLDALLKKDDNGVVTIAKDGSDEYKQGQMLARGFLELTDKEKAETKKTMDADSWEAMMGYVKTISLDQLQEIDKKNKTKAYTVKRVQQKDGSFKDVREANEKSAIWSQANLLSKYKSGEASTGVIRKAAELESKRQVQDDVRVRDEARAKAAKSAKPVDKMTEEEKSAEAAKPKIVDIKEKDGSVKFDLKSADKNLAKSMEGSDLVKMDKDSEIFKNIAVHLSTAQLRAMSEEGSASHLSAAVKIKAEAAQAKVTEAKNDVDLSQEERDNRQLEALAEISKLLANQATRRFVPTDIKAFFNVKDGRDDDNNEDDWLSKVNSQE